MLSIEREPVYKNRFVLSGAAVLAGFFVTVGIIRAANPVDTSTNQSTQTSEDRRAASLVPINASESESSSESGDASSGATSNDATASQNTNAGSWIAPTPTKFNSSSQSSAPAPSSGPTGSQATSVPAPASTPAQPEPTPSQPAGGCEGGLISDVIGVLTGCN